MTPSRQSRKRHGLVGRERELAVARAVLGAGRRLLFEGPAGVGKTTVALAACGLLGRDAVRVDGDDRYFDSRLTGWFDPPLVLRQGYREESFFPGPLVAAMREGRTLFINELNRMPESVQNVLLPALDERRLQVPHIGEVRAAAGFQVVATQNPVEHVATGHLCEALRDRFEHLTLFYQDAAEEEAIVAAATGSDDAALVRTAVRLTRATRLHPRFRTGASVRGAIATVAIAERLWAESRDPCGPVSRETLRRAAEAALTTRADLRDDSDADFATALDELLALVVDRGEGPDVALVAATGGRADSAAVGADNAAAGNAADCAGAQDSASARVELAERLGAADEELDGWKLAGALSAGTLTHAGAGARACAQRLAAGAVLRRARALVGPLRAGTRDVLEPWNSSFGGELALEPTLENVLGKEWPEVGEWVVRRRVERRRQVVLMVDTSLSMAGEKMALAVVAAAVLALELHPGDLAVVLFSSRARAVSRLGEEVRPDELVRRMLAQPCGGATDIAAALETGRTALARGRDPRRSGLLITDGVCTAGPDPCAAAARFRDLHVLLTHDDARRSGSVWITPRRMVGEAVARAGNGGIVRVDGFAALPRRMLDVADKVLR